MAQVTKLGVLGYPAGIISAPVTAALIFNQYDWPTPAGPQWWRAETNEQGFLQLPAVPIGIPIGRQEISLSFGWKIVPYDYTHIDQGFLQLPTVVVGTPVGGEAFALPIQPPIYDYTHIDQGFLQLPAAAPVATPINRYIGFLPIQPAVYRDYTFIDRGALRFPYVPPPLPKNQYDWPVPIAPRPAENLRTHIHKTQTQLIGKDQLPFRQQDWPLPTYPRPASDLRTYISRSPIQFPVPKQPPGKSGQPLPEKWNGWPWYAIPPSTAWGQVIYGVGIPPVIPPLPIPPPPIEHVRPYLDQYYGVMYAEEVTRGEPHFAQYKGADFKKAGN